MAPVLSRLLAHTPGDPPIPDTIDPKRSPIRADTRQQPAPKPTLEPVRISTKPQPTRATDAGLMPKPMPRMNPPKQKSEFAGRWIEAAIQQTNSRVKPPIPAGKRSYQAGPFRTDNHSLTLSLPPSEYPMQQRIQDRFREQYGDMLTTYRSYEAAQEAADQAAKIFSAMAKPVGVVADIDDVLDDDDD